MSTSSSNGDRAPFIVRFFDPSGHGKDARGRTLAQILAWPDSRLEMSHDYIQILFPLPEGSIFNSMAPVITQDIREIFRNRNELRNAHCQAFERILSFYGLQVVRDVGIPDREKQVVEKGPNWDENASNWVTPFNHNHLRITRIIRSLRVLGSEAEGMAFFDGLSSLQEVQRSVSKRSLMYWERAARRPLHLPPDEDDDNAAGVEWLRELHQQ